MRVIAKCKENLNLFLAIFIMSFPDIRILSWVLIFIMSFPDIKILSWTLIFIMSFPDIRILNWVLVFIIILSNNPFIVYSSI